MESDKNHRMGEQNGGRSVDTIQNTFVSFVFFVSFVVLSFSNYRGSK